VSDVFIAPRRTGDELRSTASPFPKRPACGPRQNHMPGARGSLRVAVFRKGAKPQEGRQSRERQADCDAGTTLESPPGSGTVKSTSGRRERRARAGKPVQGGAGESLGGANVQEGKVRRPPRSRGGASGPSPAGAILWSRVRAAEAARGNDMRGEAPRGVPPVGGSKALKEKPHGCRDGRRVVAGHEGEQAVERVVKP
jgi:hypothetical protein